MPALRSTLVIAGFLLAAGSAWGKPATPAPKATTPSPKVSPTPTPASAPKKLNLSRPAVPCETLVASRCTEMCPKFCDTRGGAGVADCKKGCTADRCSKVSLFGGGDHSDSVELDAFMRRTLMQCIADNRAGGSTQNTSTAKATAEPPDASAAKMKNTAHVFGKVKRESLLVPPDQRDALAEEATHLPRATPRATPAAKK